MISKAVIVFWSVVCLTITMNLMAKDSQGTGTIIYILGNGLLWAIVVVPVALIGQLFKSPKVYNAKMQMIRGGILTAVGLIAFVIAVGSQHAPSPPKQTQHEPTIYQWAPDKPLTGRGFQPWVAR